jgi:hypothetical protein
VEVKMKKLPTKCPACGATLEITELKCPKCGTEIRGNFPMDPFLSLSDSDREFLIAFLRSRGNMKEVQERLNISYPTAKNRLEKLLINLGIYEKENFPKEQEILDALERGEITAEQAVRMIREARKNG